MTTLLNTDADSKTGPELDDIDRGILNRIQGEFPIAQDPYAEIGRPYGISAQEALSRVIRLKDTGVIRKVGPFFDAKKMGHSSTLCAVDVPPDKLEEAAGVISGYPEVTHNYLRAGVPNVWFTVIAPSKDAIDGILAEIAQKCSIGPIRNLPAIKTFKIKVDLKVTE